MFPPHFFVLLLLYKLYFCALLAHQPKFIIITLFSWLLNQIGNKRHYITKTHHILFLSWKGLYAVYYKVYYINPSWLPGCCWAPLSSFWHGCIPLSFSSRTWGPTCLWRLGATFYGVLLIWDKAAHVFDHILHELGVLGEAPLVVAVWPACVLGHLVALVKAHGHGAA